MSYYGDEYDFGDYEMERPSHLDEWDECEGITPNATVQEMGLHLGDIYLTPGTRVEVEHLDRSGPYSVHVRYYDGADYHSKTLHSYDAHNWVRED